MKKNLSKIKSGIAAGLLAAALTSTTQAQTVTQTFLYTGGLQTFTVPAICAVGMTIEARGAGGAQTTGPAAGFGAAVKGVFNPTAGQVLYIYVGGAGTGTTGGFNGGGGGGTSNSSFGGGGGGGSDIRLNTNTLTARIMAAAGGGGSGGSQNYAPGAGSGGAGSLFSSGNGYGGGGATGCASGAAGGDNGGSAGSYGSGGGGGGFASGGQGGGQPSASTGGYGCDGLLGLGGEGGGTPYVCGGATGGVNGGGGGGGGYYGGGGGMTGTGGCNGGGGGGSSWANTTYFSALGFTPTMVSGNGVVIITYTYNGAAVSAVQTHTSLCSGTSATLTASGVSTYTWVSPSSFNSSVSVSPTANTIYTVNGTNSAGCISTKTLSILSNTGVPTMTITSPTGSICLGKTVTLSAVGALTYTWVNGVSVNGGTVTPSSTTVYSVNGTNACGTSQQTVNVLVAPLPVVASTTNGTVCAFNSTSLTAVSAATAYIWMPINLTQASIIVNPGTSTIYTVTVSDGTCSGNATVAIFVNPNPTISIAASASVVCANTPVTLTVSGAQSYSWTSGGGTNSVIVVTPTTSSLYTATGTNSFNCTVSASKAIITNPAPTVSVSASATVACTGDPVTLYVNGTSQSYQWSTGSTASFVIVNPTQTTQYTVQGTANGCMTTQSVTIAVFVPTASIAGPTAVCQGSSFTLAASGADSYVWMPGNSQFSSQTFTQSAATVYSLIATATTTDFVVTCSNTIFYNVGLLTLPTLTVSATTATICKGTDRATLTATGANSIVWSVNGGTLSGPSITYSNTIATTFSIPVTGTDANGCVGTTTFVIKVTTCNGIEEFGSGGAQVSVFPVPSNGEITISATQDLQIGVINNIGQVVKMVSLNNANGHTASVSGLAAGVYYITTDDRRLTKKIVIVE